VTNELIVAGFHRSGTSFTAQNLHHHGLFLGDDLLGAAPSNPYGHFEDRQVVVIHETLLRDNGVTWQVDRPLLPSVRATTWEHIERFVATRRSEHSFWGFKDPRVCLFLGLWRHVMPEARLLAVYRPYWSSVRSLHRRHASQHAEGLPPAESHLRFFQEPDLALRMWINHNLALIRECRAFPETSMLIRFDRLAEGYPLLQRLRQQWNLPLRQSASERQLFDPAATESGRHIEILDPELKRQAEHVMDELEKLHAD